MKNHLIATCARYAFVCLFPAFTLHAPGATAQGLPTTVPKDTVLASTAAVSVTREDLDAEMTRIPEGDRSAFLMSMSRLTKLVENILINKVLANEARQAGFDKTPEILAEIRIQTEKILAKHRGLQLRREAKKIDHSAKAREDYLVNRKEYERPAKYRTWITQVSLVGRTLEQARRIAEDVLRRAQGGEPLDQLARQYSDDAPAKENGGLNKAVQIDNIEPNIAKAIVNLTSGAFAPIVESGSSLFVVKLVEFTPAKPYTFEEIKGDLLNNAEQGYQNTIFERHLDTIRQDPTLKVNAEALDNLRPKIDAEMLKSLSAQPPAAPGGK